MKHRKVIAYPSKKLKVRQRNYTTHDLELVALVISLKIWSYYLYGIHVDVYTDHYNLQYMFYLKGVEYPTKKFVRISKRLPYECHLSP